MRGQGAREPLSYSAISSEFIRGRNTTESRSERSSDPRGADDVTKSSRTLNQHKPTRTDHSRAANPLTRPHLQESS